MTSCTFSITSVGTWVKISLSLMAIDLTPMTNFLQIIPVTNSGVNTITGSFNAFDIFSVPISTINMSNQIRITALTQGFWTSGNQPIPNLYYVPGFVLDYGIKTITSFWYKIASVQTTLVNNVNLVFLIFDQSMSRSSSFYRLEVNTVSVSQTIPTSNVIIPTYYSQYCFLAGLSSFIFSSNIGPNFNFTYPSFGIVVLSSPSMYSFKVATLSVYRMACNSTDTLYQMVSNQCYSVCPSRYYPTVLYCLPCHYTCNDCTSPAPCAVCLTSTALTLGGDLCNCLTGYFNNQAYCQLCNSSCVNCSLTQNNCTACKSGFMVSNSSCVQICGDGLLFILACDDGNMMDGDGCNAQCMVEPNYTCINGTSTTPSICSYNQPFVLGLVQSSQIKGNNVKISLDVSPAMSQFQALNLSAYFSSNLPFISMSHLYNSGVISLNIVFQQPLNNSYESLKLTFSPPTNTSSSFNWRSSSVIIPYGAHLIIHYDSSYLVSDIVQKVLIGAQVLGFLGLVLMHRKVLALQYVMVLQIIALSTSYNSDNWVIVNSFGYLQTIGINGYNNLFKDRLSPTIVQLSLSRISYSPELYKNLNLMMFIPLVLVGLSLILNIISGKVDSPFKQILSRIYVYLQYQIIPTLILFTLVNLAFGIGVTGYSYMSADSNTFDQDSIASNLSIMFVCLFGVTVLCQYYRSDEDVLSSWRGYYNDDKQSRLQFIVWIMYKFVLAFVMGLSHAFRLSLICLVILVGVYILYTCVIRPFRTGLLLLCDLYYEFVLLCLLVILYLYQVEIIDQQKPVGPVIMYTLLALVMLGGIGILSMTGYSVYRSIRYCLAKPTRTKMELMHSIDSLQHHYEECNKLRQVHNRRIKRLANTLSLPDNSQNSFEVY